MSVSAACEVRVSAAEPEESGEVVDLLAALARSVEKAKAARGEAPEPAPAKAPAEKKTATKTAAAKKTAAGKAPARKTAAKKAAPKKAS